MNSVNTAIELHDSKAAAIAVRDGSVVVHLKPVCIHKSEDRPGCDAGTMWVQESRLIFTKAVVSGGLPDFPCDIMGGELVVGDKRYDNLIPTPLAVAEPAELRLVFDAVHTVKIAGRSVRLELVGEPVYLEEFKPQVSPRHSSPIGFTICFVALAFVPIAKFSGGWLPVLVAYPGVIAYLYTAVVRKEPMGPPIYLVYCVIVIAAHIGMSFGFARLIGSIRWRRKRGCQPSP